MEDSSHQRSATRKHLILINLPAINESMRLSHLLKKSQCWWVFNPSILTICSMKDSGVTGFISHWSLESTINSILWIVFPSNTYLVPFTYKRNKQDIIISSVSSYKRIKSTTVCFMCFCGFCFCLLANPREGVLGSPGSSQQERGRPLQ